MRENILQTIDMVFGYEKDQVSKISIASCDENSGEQDWLIDVKLRNYPSVKTQLKSIDVHNAITLSLERAYLKVSRRTVKI